MREYDCDLMSEEREPEVEQAQAEKKPAGFREAAASTDSKPGLLKAAKFIRRLLPGDDQYGDALSTTGSEPSQRIGRLVSESQTERPSAARELGLGVLQAWQALSEAQGRGRGEVDVAILFTDIVGFSSWALEAGDEAALELLREVATLEDRAITDHGGSLVKRLGDGSMSAFRTAEDAVKAAIQAQRDAAAIDIQGHTPELRAGVHLGRPRKVGGDYLGVDVNIAARIGEAAKGGEVLVSDAACASLDDAAFKVGRKKRLAASGAPRDLAVCKVTALA
jgi:adenylate cyclase